MRKTLLMSFVVGLASFALVACGDGGGTGDDGDDAPPIDAPEGGAPTCADYCADITANCTAVNQQYSDEANCLAVCAAFTVGTTADTTGNTLGCRLYHAGNALADPATHCVHAGPGGAGVCGANCDGFCTIALDACPAAFADPGTCMTECGNFTDDEPYDVSDTSGDTLACRLYHLTQATTTPDPHCLHIVANSPTC